MVKTLAELRESKAEQFGALLIFKQGVPPERITAWVEQLRAKGVLDMHENSTGVHSFNPDWGSPCWYVP